ncbi:MAG: hypothetical protein Q9216_007261, partial [Gyalolechia sp. 2 TL-2023]
TEVCDIFDKPYYAKKGRPNWSENRGFTRHQVVWQGWAEDDRATALSTALYNRCHVQPFEFIPYMIGEQRVADFSLPSSPGKKSRQDYCWCIFDAVFDASGGIVTDREDWCEGAETVKGDDGLKDVNDELRRREDGDGKEEGFVPLGRLKRVG